MSRAVSASTWQTAQTAEQAWWREQHTTRLGDLMDEVAEGHRWTAGLLDIGFETVGGQTVLDIAAGPYPLGMRDLGLRSYTALDSLAYPEHERIVRVQQQAEGADLGEQFDEVWGYNVLQHVRDPAAVMATARRHARHTIRWREWTDTPTFPIHPHSISAAWLRAQFTGFEIVRCIQGVKTIPEYTLSFIAIVAERL